MNRSLYLLIAIVALYLLTGYCLQAIYGPSFGFLAGEDCWIPDGQGGWVAHGKPGEPAPPGESVKIPLMVQYLPIFVPAFVLILFLFTPLSRRLDRPKTESNEESDDESTE